MSDDLIKRSDAVKAIEDLPNAYNGWSDTYDKAYIIGTLEEVLSADRPRGHWRDTGKVYFGAKVYACSVCGEECDEMPTCMGKPMWKYCPYCGADMRGAGDDIDNV